MAETLDELQRQLEAMSRQLGGAEQRSEGSAGRATDTSLDAAELRQQIELLGSKIDLASELLAEFTDVLEAQTERIETLEQQLGDPDAGEFDAAAPHAAPEAEARSCEGESLEASFVEAPEPGAAAASTEHGEAGEVPAELGVLAALERLAAVINAVGGDVAADRPEAWDPDVDSAGEESLDSGDPAIDAPGDHPTARRDHDDTTEVVVLPESAGAPLHEQLGLRADPADDESTAARAGAANDSHGLSAVTRRLDSLESVVLDFLEIYADQSGRTEVPAGGRSDASADESEPRSQLSFAATREATRVADLTEDDLVESVSSAAAQSASAELREFLVPRLDAMESRLTDIERRTDDLRRLVGERDRQVRDLEERILFMVEPPETPAVAAARTARTPSESAREATTPRIEAPAPHHEPPARAGSPAQDSAREGSSASMLPVAYRESPAKGQQGAAQERLAQLVEREVALKREFRVGGVAPVAGEPTKGRPHTSVMVVDDSSDARTILSIFLSKTGFHVVTAASSEDCLAKLRHHHVDAIVLDARMPGADGAQVCRTVREDPRYSDQRSVPIIVYTGYPDEFSRETVREWGADDYVVKGGDLFPLVTVLLQYTNPRSEAHP